MLNGDEASVSGKGPQGARIAWHGGCVGFLPPAASKSRSNSDKVSNLDKADLSDLIFFVPLIRSADLFVSIHAPSQASPSRTSFPRPSPHISISNPHLSFVSTSSNFKPNP